MTFFRHKKEKEKLDRVIDIEARKGAAVQKCERIYLDNTKETEVFEYRTVDGNKVYSIDSIVGRTENIVIAVREVTEHVLLPRKEVYLWTSERIWEMPPMWTYYAETGRLVYLFSSNIVSISTTKGRVASHILEED